MRIMFYSRWSYAIWLLLIGVLLYHRLAGLLQILIATAIVWFIDREIYMHQVDKKAEENAARVKSDLENISTLDAEGKYRLAIMLEGADGISPDAERAAELYRQAAESGHEWAMYEWGVRLREGRGVATNTALAKQWFEKAAAKGSKLARTRLDEILDD